MAPGVVVGRLARNAKDSMEISFLWLASALSPGMPSSARKMSAEGPPVWEVSNGEAPPLPKPPPPEVSVPLPLPLSPGGPGSPWGLSGRWAPAGSR